MASKAAFRSLVVVPQSHADGTFEKKAGLQLDGRCEVHYMGERAIQLDVRPNKESQHQSAFLLWNSKVVHQGTTWPSKKGFQPKVKVPQMFDPAAAENWKSHLQREGYVVIKDVLQRDNVKQALNLLLEDCQFFNPKIEHLDQVRERDLPPAKHGNDLRMTGGICHGKFAWFLRTCPEVSRLFETLFELPKGAPMTGSVDVVALAPPDSISEASTTREWLHLDYTPPQGDIWQGTLQLFPESKETGSRWVRIGIMICKAPLSWAAPATAANLLAACLVGAPSKATAAVTRGELHPPQKPRKKRLIPDSTDPDRAQELRGKSLQDVINMFEKDPSLRKLVPRVKRNYVAPRRKRKHAELDD